MYAPSPLGSSTNKMPLFLYVKRHSIIYLFPCTLFKVRPFLPQSYIPFPELT